MNMVSERTGTKIEVIEGNIVHCTERLIVQQVNCMGKMGKGVAKAIADKFKNVKPRYEIHCEKHFFDKSLLGTVLYIEQETKNRSIYIANVFGQFDIGELFQQTNYLKLLKGLQDVNNFCIEHNIKEIAMPYGMSCGLAGGDWNKVIRIIEHALTDVEKIKLYRKR